MSVEIDKVTRSLVEGPSKTTWWDEFEFLLSAISKERASHIRDMVKKRDSIKDAELETPKIKLQLSESEKRAASIELDIHKTIQKLALEKLESNRGTKYAGG